MLYYTFADLIRHDPPHATRKGEFPYSLRSVGTSVNRSGKRKLRIGV